MLVASVSAKRNSVIVLWYLESGSVQDTLEGHSDPITDSRLIASGSFDATLRVWDVETGHVRRTFKTNFARIIALAISSDGVLIASASQDYTVKVWNVQDEALIESVIVIERVHQPFFLREDRSLHSEHGHLPFKSLNDCPESSSPERASLLAVCGEWSV
ncbi:WD40-repeat-containing domain protein [Delphinella strobiligena]|nr:WD40-repeat-containing domain protein [Delphinella strobiligena]